MKFEQSGLPKGLEIAFEKSYNYVVKMVMQQAREEIAINTQSVEQQVNTIIEQQGLKGADLEDVRKQEEENVKMLTTQILSKYRQSIDSEYMKAVIKPALVALNFYGSEEAKQEAGKMLAESILLIGIVQTPNDYERVKSEFSAETCEIISNVIDYQTYINEQSEKIKTMSQDEHAVLFSISLSSLEGMKDYREAAKQGKDLTYIGGKDAYINYFTIAETVRGMNTDYDADFIELFNEFADMFNLGLEVKAVGDTEIVLNEKALKPPTLPPASNQNKQGFNTQSGAAGKDFGKKNQGKGGQPPKFGGAGKDF